MNTNYNNDVAGALKLITINGSVYQLGKDASTSEGGIMKLFGGSGALDTYKTSTDGAYDAKTVYDAIAAAQAAATYDDTALAARVTANEGDLTTLKAGATTAGSVAYQIAQIVNENQNGSIDTLNEIAAWIVNDTTGAAKMAADISALQTAMNAVDYSGKADKVASATSGNFAGLDANGNLTDSGFKAADFQAAGSYKTTQEIVADPTADGTGITFIATASQNANGEITVTKKTVQTVEASTSGAGGQAGLMTAAQAEKLAGIATGAQVNVLEGITIANGAATAAGALTPDGNKGVTITIPNNTNQLTNGAGFQNASEVNTAIAAAIANLKTASFEVVANIPTVAEAEAGVIYLVAHAGHNPGTNDSYDEYVLINTGSNDEPVMAIEKIGNTDINLSNYWSKDEIGFATDQEVEDALDAVFNA
jgi:hypothetical protein